MINDKENSRLIETAVAMTNLFWRMERDGKIHVPEDSRDIWTSIRELAKRFEETHVNVSWDDVDAASWDDVDAKDYYEEVETFTSEYFLKWFGADDMEQHVDAVNYKDLRDKFIYANPVIREGDDEMDGILCPLCKCEVARNDDYPEMRPKHCPECGCKLSYGTMHKGGTLC